MRIALTIAFLCLQFAPAARAAVSEIGGDVGVWSVGPDLDSDTYQPASAIDFVNGRYLMIWSQDEGDAGFRVFAAGVDGATDTPFAQPLQLDAGVGNARQCAAAFDRTTERYLVVWEQDADAPGAFEIFGRFLDADIVPDGPQFKISEAGSSLSDPNFDAHHPSVASDGEGHFLVCWAQDDDVSGFGNGVFDIYARKVSSNGQLHGAPNQRLTDVSVAGSVPNADALDPVVVFNVAAENYAILYEGDFVGGPFYDPNVWLLPVDLNGIPKRTVVPIQLSQSSGSKRDDVYAKNPAMAYDPRQKQMLAVWDASDGIEPSIASRVIYSDYSLSPSTVVLSEPPGGGGSACFALDPAVAYNLHSDTFVVLWSGNLASQPSCGGLLQTMLREVDNAGQPLAAAPVAISDPPQGPSGGLSVASADLIPNPVHPGLLAWWSGDPLTSGHFGLFGQFLSNTTATSVPDDRPSDLPRSLELAAAPNPFNPRTVLSFGLPTAGPVKLSLYDVRGQLIRVVLDEFLPAGRYERSWNGRDQRGQTVASGVYFTRLEHSGKTRNMRVVLVK